MSVSIEASANPVDLGTAVTFTATAANGGAAPVYQWIVNGSTVGTNSNTYSYEPADGDIVSCMLTSNASCISGNPASSAPIVMVVISVPVIRNINNILVTGIQCFDATQTISVAGNGTTFIIPAGATATMIAGENIVYYPGTYVEPGGYMAGYIAHGGPWCVAPALPSAVNGLKGATPDTEQDFFRIYPNPTAGNFMFEWNTPGIAGNCLVEIYTMKGEKLLSANLATEPKREFSLSGRPSGIYLVRVISERFSGIMRIVKQ